MFLTMMVTSGPAARANVPAGPGCAANLFEEQDPRRILQKIEGRWTLADDALELTDSLNRTIGYLDRTYGRRPNTSEDRTTRADLSRVMMSREWRELRSLGPDLIARCVAELEASPRSAVMKDRLRLVLVASAMELDEYLAQPLNQSRLTELWRR